MRKAHLRSGCRDRGNYQEKYEEITRRLCLVFWGLAQLGGRTTSILWEGSVGSRGN